MLTFARLTTALILIGGLYACNAPPSVQKVIDEAKAKEEAAQPRLDNPVQSAAQDEGREVYFRYLTGRWAPQDKCGNADLQWTFAQDSFSRPRNLSTVIKPCKLALVEALDDGSYAIAGYCPRLELEDEPVVIPLTRTGDEQIIIAGVGGGALVRCP